MAIFRRNNINTKRAAESQGGLAALLRTYGSIGGANPRVERISREKARQAEVQGLPSILTRIYAPTTLDIAPLPYEASNVSNRASMVERIYEQKNEEK